MTHNKYFSLVKNENVATVNIYGDITSWPWSESDVSSYNLAKQLDGLTDVDEIHVYISSYGGEVKEGLAIYSALKRHKAKVKTFVDGFACSIASVIFMAGDERIMSDASLLMVHNAWTYAEGNANDLRKQADDLDKITQASINAYKANSKLDEDAIKAMLDAETWLLPAEAVSYGFATAIVNVPGEKQKAAQSVKKQLVGIIAKYRAAVAAADDEAEDETGDEAPEDTDTDDPETENPDEAPADDDPEAEDEETEADGEEETEDEAESDKEPAQRWSGFFNALMK